MSEFKKTFCRICEPYCPLLAEVDDGGKVVSLNPDPSHPCKGIPCHKGLSFLDVHNDPDRLNRPLRRKNSRRDEEGIFEDIDWDIALAEIGEKLRNIRDKYGNDSIAIYVGNPNFGNSGVVAYIEDFKRQLGTRMCFSASTQDMINKVYGAMAIYGSTGIPIPDLTHTDYLLCLGGNPKVSHWSIVSVPNDSGQILKNIKARGGKVRFVNPRDIESATSETGETLLIKPDTDAYFLAAVLNEIHKQGGFDQNIIDQHASHIEEMLEFVQQYPADRVASVTGIEASIIKEVAAEMVSAKSAAVYMSTGVNQGRQGTLCFWLSEMINFATGNLGAKGGTYKSNGFLSHYPQVNLNGQTISTSVGDFEFPKPMNYMVMPGTLLSDFVNGGDIKALITLSGNPVNSIAGETRMREAFENLELMVTMDINLNLTAEISDYVLPGTDWLERADINTFSDGAQLIPYVQYTDPMAAPSGERRDDWWSLARIAQEMGLPSPLDDHENLTRPQLLDKLLSVGGLSVEQLKAHPNQVHLFPDDDYSSFFEKCVQHTDKKVDCYPQRFSEGGLYDRCETIFTELSQEPDSVLKMISMRTNYMHNSWMSNVSKLRVGLHSANPLNICEADAMARDLYDGDKVRVYNENGSLETRVRVNNAMRPGAVAMSHGYGKGRPGMKVAEDNHGANPNLLLPTGDKPYAFEPLSYMSWMCGVPVTIERIS